MVHFSHPYMTTAKTIVLTIRTVDKVVSLLFDMLWLQSPSMVILELKKKIKSLTVSIVSTSICCQSPAPAARDST